MNQAQAERYRRRWGLPDWHNIGSYPVSLTDEQWRWEFTRRRDDYREDWLRSFAKTVAWYRKHKPGPASFCGPYGHGVFPDNWGNGSESGRFRAHLLGSIEKYGLRGLANPALPYLEHLNFEPPDPGFLAPGRLHWGPGPRRIPPGCACISIDMSQPIERQIRDARRILRRDDVREAFSGITKKEARRKRRDLWRTYLRVLDAKAAGLKYREIWRWMSGDVADDPKARGRDLVQQALRVRNNCVPLSSHRQSR